MDLLLALILRVTATTGTGTSYSLASSEVFAERIFPDHQIAIRESNTSGTEQMLFTSSERQRLLVLAGRDGTNPRHS